MAPGLSLGEIQGVGEGPHQFGEADSTPLLATSEAGVLGLGGRNAPLRVDGHGAFMGLAPLSFQGEGGRNRVVDCPQAGNNQANRRWGRQVAGWRGYLPVDAAPGARRPGKDWRFAGTMCQIAPMHRRGPGR